MSETPPTSRYLPLTFARHGRMHIKERESFADVADQAIVSLYAHEYRWASAEFPIAFWRKSEESQFGIVAVLSPVLGANCMVTQGDKWLGLYIPALLRQVPFSYAESDQGVVFFVDELSHCLSATEGEAIFTPEGGLSPYMEQLKRFMHNLRARSTLVMLAVKALAEYNIIVPWKYDKPVDEKLEQHNALSNLWQVDFEALQALPDNVFQALREAGAIDLAYAQHYSMRRLPHLQRTATLARLAGASKEALPTRQPQRLYREDNGENEKAEVLKDDPLAFNFF